MYIICYRAYLLSTYLLQPYTQTNLSTTRIFKKEAGNPNVLKHYLKQYIEILQNMLLLKINNSKSGANYKVNTSLAPRFSNIKEQQNKLLPHYQSIENNKYYLL